MARLVYLWVRLPNKSVQMKDVPVKVIEPPKYVSSFLAGILENPNITPEFKKSLMEGMNE